MEYLVEVCCVHGMELKVTSDLCDEPLSTLPEQAWIKALQHLATHMRAFPHLFTVDATFSPIFVPPFMGAETETCVVDWLYVAYITHPSDKILTWLMQVYTGAPGAKVRAAFATLPSTIEALGPSPLYALVKDAVAPVLAVLRGLVPKS